MNDLMQLGIPDGTTPFPRIQELRGLYKVSYRTLAGVIGAESASTAHKKIMSGRLTMLEMFNITNFMNSLGANETVSSLFLDWISQSRNNDLTKAM